MKKHMFSCLPAACLIIISAVLIISCPGEVADYAIVRITVVHSLSIVESFDVTVSAPDLSEPVTEVTVEVPSGEDRSLEIGTYP